MYSPVVLTQFTNMIRNAISSRYRFPKTRRNVPVRLIGLTPGSDTVSFFASSTVWI
jgi:hypothetical protein